MGGEASRNRCGGCYQSTNIVIDPGSGIDFDKFEERIKDVSEISRLIKNEGIKESKETTVRGLTTEQNLAEINVVEYNEIHPLSKIKELSTKPKMKLQKSSQNSDRTKRSRKSKKHSERKVTIYEEKQEEESNKVLRIKIVMSKYPRLVGKEINLSSVGCKEGLRKVKDGQCIFGIGEPSAQDSTPGIDIFLTPPDSTKETSDSNVVDKNKKNKEPSALFSVAYDKKGDEYLLKNLNKNSMSVFFKLDTPKKIENKLMVSFGQTCILFELFYQQASDGVYRSQKEGNRHFLSPGDNRSARAPKGFQKYKNKRGSNYTMGDKPKHQSLSVSIYNSSVYVRKASFNWWITPVVKIGRDASKSHLAVADPLASKVQCTLKFTPNTGWMIFDGVEEGKGSTNSTWFYDPGDVVLEEGRCWKVAGSTLLVEAGD
jgi:hypothetical protein